MRPDQRAKPGLPASRAKPVPPEPLEPPVRLAPRDRKEFRELRDSPDYR